MAYSQLSLLMLTALAVVVAVVVNQIAPVIFTAVEGFQSGQTPIQKAKRLLSFLEFEGTGTSQLLRVTTPGGLRVDKGGVTITHTDDSTTFAQKAGGLLLTLVNVNKPFASLPKGSSSVGTTWSFAPDKNGVLAASVTDYHPIEKDGGYVPLVGFSRSQKDGTLVVPSM